ncbi:hypothetical protein MJO47_04430 [Desulfuromonas sp. KJ2020]|uniref:hypothetical protein n=1 Tax=Desulfuromonas sp. KJ2020 TaxID=2919173 RepID=UPI0020A6FEE4|nr:hypothetical protein [Desulfuromonas sp. KJ2020]MCP3176340.1 hypothetical protein [Desulfuromonas sp. KJ2020]
MIPATILFTLFTLYACHIFERPTGKVYLYRCNEPHRVVDFYDLHFSTTGITTSGLASSSRLNIALPGPETGELESFTGFFCSRPKRPCASGTRWCATWTGTGPLTSATGSISTGWCRKGYRVEGVRHPDGTVEWA